MPFFVVTLLISLVAITHLMLLVFIGKVYPNQFFIACLSAGLMAFLSYAIFGFSSKEAIKWSIASLPVTASAIMLFPDWLITKPITNSR